MSCGEEMSLIENASAALGDAAGTVDYQSTLPWPRVRACLHAADYALLPHPDRGLDHRSAAPALCICARIDCLFNYKCTHTHTHTHESGFNFCPVGFSCLTTIVETLSSCCLCILKKSATSLSDRLRKCDAMFESSTSYRPYLNTI